MLTVGDLKLPTVPRACHDAIDELPFGERAALVRTDSVDGLKLPIDVEQRNDPTADRELLPTADRHVGRRSQLLPVRHQNAFLI